MLYQAKFIQGRTPHIKHHSYCRSVGRLAGWLVGQFGGVRALATEVRDSQLREGCGEVLLLQPELLQPCQQSPARPAAEPAGPGAGGARPAVGQQQPGRQEEKGGASQLSLARDGSD